MKNLYPHKEPFVFPSHFSMNYAVSANFFSAKSKKSLKVSIDLKSSAVGLNPWRTYASRATALNAAIGGFAAKFSIAASKDLAVADMNAIMNQLVSGLRIETGQQYTANYFSGSTTEGIVLFSLDGVHPNARGYAVITNEIIKVINSYYNANIPLTHPSYFPGINIVPTN